MKKVRITVMRKACYPDLMEKYENPIGMPAILRRELYSLPMAGKGRRGCVRVPGRPCLLLSWDWHMERRISTMAG